MGWKKEASNIRSGLSSGAYKKKRNYAKAFMEPFARGIERQEIERIQKDKEDRARAAAASKAAAAEQKALDKADAARQGMVSMIMLNNGIEPTAEINNQLMMVAKNGNITDVSDFQTYYDDYIKYDQGRAATPLNTVEKTLPPEMQIRQDQISAAKTAKENRILNFPENQQKVLDGDLSQQRLEKVAAERGDEQSTKNLTAPDPAAFAANEKQQMDDLGLGGADPSLTFGKKPTKVADMDQRAIVAELNNSDTSPERKVKLQAGLDAINFKSDEDQFDNLPTVTDLDSYETALVLAEGLEGSAKEYSVKRIKELGIKLRTKFNVEFLSDLTTIEKLLAKEAELAAMKGTDANGEAVVNESYPGQVEFYQGIIDKQMTKFSEQSVAESRRKQAESADSIRLRAYTRNLKTGTIDSPISVGSILQTPTGDTENPFVYTDLYGKILEPATLKKYILHDEGYADTVVKTYNKAVTEATDYITESTVAVTAIMDLQAFIESSGRQALNPVTNWLGKLVDKGTAAGEAALTLSNIFQNDDGSLKPYKKIELAMLDQISSLGGDDAIVAQKTLAAAYAIAKMRGSVGQALSDKELKAILETLGVGMTKPEKVIKLLDQLILSEVPAAETRRKGFVGGIIKVGGEVEILNTTTIGTPVYSTILAGLAIAQDKEKFSQMFADPLAGRPFVRPTNKQDASPYDPLAAAQDAVVTSLTEELPDIFSNPSGGAIALTPKQMGLVNLNLKAFVKVLKGPGYNLSDDEVKVIIEKAKKELGI